LDRVFLAVEGLDFEVERDARAIFEEVRSWLSGDLIDDVDPFWAMSDGASSHALYSEL
jgi:hypothetical protein